MTHIIKSLVVFMFLSNGMTAFSQEESPEEKCKRLFDAQIVKMNDSDFFSGFLSELNTGFDLSVVSDELKYNVTKFTTSFYNIHNSPACSNLPEIKDEALVIRERLQNWTRTVQEVENQRLEQESQSSYLGTALTITVLALSTFAAGGAYFIGPYKNGKSPGHLLAQFYYKLFKLLTIVVVETEYVSVAGPTEYVEVEGPTKNIATKYSIFNEAARLLNSVFKGGYGTKPFSSANHIDMMDSVYGYEKQENIRIVADYLYEHPKQNNNFYIEYIKRMFRK